MEIRHASLAQVRRGRDGRRVAITEDLHDIVARLQEIDPGLKVFWNEYGEYYTIVETLADGSEGLVTNVPSDGLNAQLVDYVRMLGSERYSYIEEAERADAKAQAEGTHRFEEEIGEQGEKMAHAIRKDLEAKNRIYVPRAS